MQKSYKTKVTQEIQQYLKLQNQKSFSAADVYHYLESNNIDVNQSTVYRTLDRMIEHDCDFMNDIRELLMKQYGFTLECNGSTLCGLCADCKKKEK